MDRAYFRKYHDFEKSHWWFRARAEILAEYISKQLLATKAPSILNVGAATGGSIEWLAKLGSVTSLEYDGEAVRFIREELKQPVTEGSILALPYANASHDLVCAFDVIEHVEDDGLAVRELARVCRPGGSVLITVPAHMHLWSPHDVVNHHFRRYSRKSLEDLAKSLPGGSIIFLSYFNSYLYAPIALARKLKNALAGVRKSRPPVSDFESFRPGITNEILYGLMRKEKELLSRQRSFRTGVSLLLHWKKDRDQ